MFQMVSHDRAVGQPIIWSKFRGHNVVFGWRSVATAFVAALHVRGTLSASDGPGCDRRGDAQVALQRALVDNDYHAVLNRGRERLFKIFRALHRTKFVQLTITLSRHHRPETSLHHFHFYFRILYWYLLCNPRRLSNTCALILNGTTL